MVVEPYIAVKSCPWLFAGPEMMALKHLRNTTVDASDHDVGQERFRRSQTVLEPELHAGFVELVLPRRGVLAQAPWSTRRDPETVSNLDKKISARIAMWQPARSKVLVFASLSTAFLWSGAGRARPEMLRSRWSLVQSQRTTAKYWASR